MKDKSNSSGIKAVTLAVFVSMGIYIVLSMLGIYMFGSLIKPDLLDSIGEEEYTWATTALCIAFFFVIVCHIPFVFFYGKETFLILIDELDRRSISHALDERITNINVS